MRRCAQVLAVALLAGCAGFCASDPTVAWYRFEEGQTGQVVPGNAQVADSGPNGLTGWTPYNCHARRVPGIAPGSERAWDVAALDDWFLVPDAPTLALDGSLTLEAWVKLRGYQRTAVSNFIVFRGDSTPGWDSYCLALSPDGDLFFHIEGPGFRAGDPVPTVKCPFVWFGMPVHVAGVFNAQKGSLSLYVNGDLMASMVTRVRPRVPLNPAMGPGLGVGGYHGGARSSFAIDGVIDEVRVSSAALEPRAFVCGEMPALEWVGTKGFEEDGVEPDRGEPDSSFLFAVRYETADAGGSPVRLELRHDGQCLEPVSMTLGGGPPNSGMSVYRARVALGPGKWEYRFSATGTRGEPLLWRPGPVVSAAAGG